MSGVRFDSSPLLGGFHQSRPGGIFEIQAVIGVEPKYVFSSKGDWSNVKDIFFYILSIISNLGDFTFFLTFILIKKNLNELNRMLLNIT